MDLLIQLKGQLTNSVELLKRTNFLQDKCAAVTKLFTELLALLEPGKAQKNGASGFSSFHTNKLLQTLQRDPDLTFLISEAVRRLKLFLNLYLVHETKTEDKPDLDEEKFKFLKRTWVILNCTAIQKDLCTKVKDIFSLTGRLVPKDKRKEFESDFKKIIAKPVSRSKMILEFDEQCGHLTQVARKRMDRIVLTAVHNFFINLKTELEQKDSKRVIKAEFISDKPVGDLGPEYNKTITRLSTNLPLLKQVLEVELIRAMKIGMTEKPDITESSIKLNLHGLTEGRFGDMVYHSMVNPMRKISVSSKNKKRVTDDSSVSLFMLLQEVKLAKSSNELDCVLAPESFNVPDGLNLLYDLSNAPVSFVYKRVKMSLSSLICNNRVHTLYDFTEFESVCILLSVVTALEFLHSKGFVHNNVSTKSIYVCFASGKGSINPANMQGLVKLGNFAVCGDEHIPSRGKAAIRDRSSEDLEYLEEFIYSSPEAILSEENLSSNDIYSLAFVAWRLLHYKKDPVSSLLSAATSGGGHHSFPTTDGNHSGSLLPKPILLLNGSNNLALLPRQQMVKKLSRAILKGYRPQFDFQSTIGSSGHFMRDELLQVVSRMWDDELSARPTAAYLKGKFKKFYQDQTPFHLTQQKEMMKIFGGIIANLRNGTNHELRVALTGETEHKMSGNSHMPLSRTQSKSTRNGFEQAASVDSSGMSKRTRPKSRKKKGRFMTMGRGRSNTNESGTSGGRSTAIESSIKSNKKKQIGKSMSTDTKEMPIKEIGAPPPMKKRMSMLSFREKGSKTGRIKGGVSRLGRMKKSPFTLKRTKSGKYDFAMDDIERNDDNSDDESELDKILFEEAVTSVEDGPSDRVSSYDSDEDEYQSVASRGALGRLRNTEMDASFKFVNGPSRNLGF